MTPRSAFLRPFLLFAIAGGLCACAPATTNDAVAGGRAVWPTQPATVAEPTDAVESGDAPSSTPLLAPTDGSADDADGGWRALEEGLEARTMAVLDPSGALIERPIVVRIDPGRYAFDVAYRPGAPQPLTAWQAKTGAAVVVNGGYFTEENVATGRIISAGTPSGLSYGDFAGMFAVTASGPEVRWLGQRPFDASEPLLAAVQSFPILVRPDGGAAYAEEDGKVARRTIVGQDGAGRIVLAVMPLGGFSLHALSEWLAAADDLDLRLAFNLDGGASSGLLLPDGSGDPGLVPVPAVIVARRR